MKFEWKRRKHTVANAPKCRLVRYYGRRMHLAREFAYQRRDDWLSQAIRALEKKNQV